MMSRQYQSCFKHIAERHKTSSDIQDILPEYSIPKTKKAITDPEGNSTLFGFLLLQALIINHASVYQTK